MPYPLQSGGVGGATFLLVLVVYLTFALLYLLFPVLVVSLLRGDRVQLGGLVRERIGGLVPGRLGERLGAGRSGAVGSRDR